MISILPFAIVLVVLLALAFFFWVVGATGSGSAPSD
jgi:hypothetical protein